MSILKNKEMFCIFLIVNESQAINKINNEYLLQALSVQPKPHYIPLNNRCLLMYDNKTKHIKNTSVTHTSALGDMFLHYHKHTQ